MRDRKLRSRMSCTDDVLDKVMSCVINYIDDPPDREAVSMVCRRWYELDAMTRKHVTVQFCYAATPKQLWQRFRHLQSLKLKGQPRAMMFSLIPKDWGGYATPWVEEIAKSFDCLQELKLRRMIITDSDLELLAQSRGPALQVLQLHMCSGFSTDGLLHIARFCRNLRTLFLEECTIIENDSEWLRQLALHNKVLETLNFYMTDLSKVRFQDLELIAKNCSSSLVTVKIGDCEILDLVGFFRAADRLEEFGGGSFNNQPEKYSAVTFSPRLCRVGLTYAGKNDMPIVFPFASVLRKLDLLYALLDTEDHCCLIQRCPNLESIETRTVIDDRGLEVLARCCKRLKRLKIERGADEEGMIIEEGAVSQKGLTALAHGCLDLEYLYVYAANITNSCLECMGSRLKNLYDIRLVLLGRKKAELSLDDGMRALLRGCHKLRRFGLYLRPGDLTDVGLRYIGQYGQNVRYLLLGSVGESDTGLLELSRGCPNLEKLEIRACSFSELALATAVLQLTSLRFVWAQGYKASATGCDLLVMARPFWNIELTPSRRVVVSNSLGESVVVEQPASVLAYYSLAGHRTDFPETVMPMDATSFLPS